MPTKFLRNDLVHYLLMFHKIETGLPLAVSPISVTSKLYPQNLIKKIQSRGGCNEKLIYTRMFNH